MKLHPQFIVDAKGRKKRVILSMKEFYELMECLQDVIDAKLIEEVRDEPTIPWEQVKQEHLRRADKIK